MNFSHPSQQTIRTDFTFSDDTTDLASKTKSISSKQKSFSTKTNSEIERESSIRSPKKKDFSYGNSLSPIKYSNSNKSNISSSNSSYRNQRSSNNVFRNQTVSDIRASSYRTNSSNATSSESLKTIMKKGGMGFRNCFNLQLKNEDRLYEIRAQIDDIQANIDQINTRIKYLKFKNDAGEEKIRKEMDSFQNHYYSNMSKLQNNLIEVQHNARELNQSKREVVNKVKNTEKQIKFFEKRIKELDDKEFEFGKKEVLLKEPPAQSGNKYVVENVAKRRENKLSKLTKELDYVKMQIDECSENIENYNEHIKSFSGNLRKFESAKITLEAENKGTEANNQKEIDELKKQLEEKANNQSEVEKKVRNLHSEQLKLSSLLTKSTKEFMKLDMKHQSIEHAIIIAQSSPGSISLDYQNQKDDELIKKYQKKIEEYGKRLIKRSKETIKTLSKTRKEKQDVLDQLKEAENEKVKAESELSKLENKIATFDQRNREDSFEDDDEYKKDIGTQKGTLNKAVCNLYFNRNSGLKAASNVVAMRLIKNEEKIKMRIKDCNLSSNVLNEQIKGQTQKNGLLFAKIRAVQIKLRKIAEDEEIRLNVIHPKVKAPSFTEVKEYIEELNENKKELKADIAQRRRMIEQKSKNLEMILLQTANYQRGGSTKKNSAQQLLKDIDELTTRAELELINWNTLRNGEDERLLEKWNNILPEVE